MININRQYDLFKLSSEKNPDTSPDSVFHDIFNYVFGKKVSSQ